MDRTTTLELATAAVGQRNTPYGNPENNFERIARRWNAHLVNLGMAADLTPSSVALMLADVKMARLENDPKHLDSWVDMAGYAACGAEVSGAGKAEPAPSGYSSDPYRTYAAAARASVRKTAQAAQAEREPETKFGFTVGEKVNINSVPPGERPGKVAGFDGEYIQVQWCHWPVGEYHTIFHRNLRHGP